MYALLTAALAAVGPGQTATLAEVHAGRHAALYGLGRLEEADEVYRTIERLCPVVLDRADATAVQVRAACGLINATVTAAYLAGDAATVAGWPWKHCGSASSTA